MTFSSYTSGAPKIETIKIGNLELHRTDKMRYLGLVLDGNMRWSGHVSFLVGKLRGMLYKFKMMTKYMIDIKHLRMLYYALVHSQIQYGILAWGGIYDSHLIHLDVIQRWILKIILKKGLTFPSKEVYTLSDVLDSRQIYAEKILNNVYIGKIKIDQLDHIYDTRNKEMKFKNPKTMKRIGQRSFTYLAPRLYSLIPVEIRKLKRKKVFKRNIKIWIKENRLLIENIINPT